MIDNHILTQIINSCDIYTASNVMKTFPGLFEECRALGHIKVITHEHVDTYSMFLTFSNNMFDVYDIERFIRSLKRKFRSRVQVLPLIFGTMRIYITCADETQFTNGLKVIGTSLFKKLVRHHSITANLKPEYIEGYTQTFRDMINLVNSHVKAVVFDACGMNIRVTSQAYSSTNGSICFVF